MSNGAQSKATSSKFIVKNYTAEDPRDHLDTTVRTFELTPKPKLMCIPKNPLGGKFFNELTDSQTQLANEVTDEEDLEKSWSLLCMCLKNNVQQTNSSTI